MYNEKTFRELKQRIIALEREISNHKQTEKILREKSDLYQKLLNNSKIVTYRREPSGQFPITFISENIFKLCGYQKETLTDDPQFWSDRIHPDDKQQVFSDMAYLLEKGCCSHDYRFLHGDGMYRWVHDELVLIRNKEGRPVDILGNCLDISDLQKTKEAVDKTLLLLKASVETLKGVIIFAIDTEYRYLFFNEVHRKGMRDAYGTEIAVGKNILDCIAKNFDRQKAKTDFDRALAGENHISIHEYGEILKAYYEIIFNPIVNDKGDIIGTITIATDITERMRTERSLRQIEKIESLKCMAGAIAHRFNNQLGVVMGNLELTLSGLQTDFTLRNNIQKALEAARCSAETSGLMLVYLGQSTVAGELIDLSDVCSRYLPTLDASITDTVIFETDFMDAGPIVLASASQMQQVIVNLIRNAVEAMGSNDEKKIILTTGTILPHDLPKSHLVPPDFKPTANRYAYLEITDSGTGIAEEHLDKLFDPFFSTRFPGRGLGLAVLLGIITQWDGAVHVDSKTGGGASFRVFLPLQGSEAIPLAPEAAPIRLVDRPMHSVLLVEDEDTVREMFEKLLEHLGYSVHSAKNGAGAIAFFEQHQNEVGCVITDLTMPDMNGWALIAALRGIDPDIPIILASGYDETDVMGGRQSERPQVFLHKPFMLNDLNAALRKAMDKSLS